MNLPSVDTSVDVLEDYHSDASSELSDPLSENESDIEDGIDQGADVELPTYSGSDVESDSLAIQRPRKRKVLPSLPDLSAKFVTDSSDLDVDDLDKTPRKYRIVEQDDLLPWKNLSKELIQHIACFLGSDADLCALSLTNKRAGNAIMPEDSAVWRLRFLTRYDQPILYSFLEYCPAYRLRRYVLGRFPGFADGKRNARAQVQLDLLRDMVLESYNKAAPHLPAPTYSRNLAAFSAPSNSPWMLTFLSSPFYAHQEGHHGRPHALFDTLQMLFSFLLLSPSSSMAHRAGTDRANYDLARVYCWDRPLVTLYARLPEEQQESSSPSFHSPLFPKLRSVSPPPRIKYDLDMHSLLHVRNFWHRHLIDDSTNMNCNVIGEHTYAGMARNLAKLGKIPEKWDKPLQDAVSVSQDWVGHYSCMHPWPKKREELEERQSCAEDWNGVDPLSLNFSAMTSNETSGFWPVIFSTFPIFVNSTPSSEDDDQSATPHTYFRGMAPFLDLHALLAKRSHSTNSKARMDGTIRKDEMAIAKEKSGAGRRKSKRKKSEDETRRISTVEVTSQPSTRLPNKTKYHPYLSLRLRGVVHKIEDQEGIPGWKRIVMVLYKPTTQHLIQVLEHAMEDYGNPFQQMVPAAAGQGSVVNGVGIHLTEAQQEAAHKVILEKKIGIFETKWVVGKKEEREEIERRRKKSRNNARSVSTDGTITDPDLDGDIEMHDAPPPCAAVSSSSTMTDLIWTPSLIAKLEDAFIPPQHLDWSDIEYAYAYEGVVIPGGKVMMGRWWRCASHAGGGIGEGMEVVEEVATGEGGEVREGWGRERGCWVFWT